MSCLIFKILLLILKHEITNTLDSGPTKDCCWQMRSCETHKFEILEIWNTMEYQEYQEYLEYLSGIPGIPGIPGILDVWIPFPAQSKVMQHLLHWCSMKGLGISRIVCHHEQNKKHLGVADKHNCARF
jgi:hypothetical protein